MASLTTPGLHLPNGGPTTMDQLRASNFFNEVIKNGQIPPKFATEWSVTATDCLSASCIRVPASVVISPNFSPKLMQAVRAVVDAATAVLPGDDETSLASRLAVCDFLDDIHAPKGGHGTGGRTERLNASTMAQPRRVSMSVRGSPVYKRESDDVEQLLNYTSYRREEKDWCARPMPPAVFDLATAIWLASYHYLSDISKELVFNHVQILFYYEMFGGSMGQHRDNWNTKHLSTTSTALDLLACHLLGTAQR